ncbi:hypothetical protein G9U51_14690 [Calidifontibacter sp. DB0510]|uniref:Uncharacterized protein n=1 Tax=Metallococcus carri TaxID=1656884 RepID=A0A967EB76_9MICO|nr:hypothetical protein [Metallococcus carri]NHN57015.1 hypothetical protein [Metallococcus carri]NOP39116.1 hypothetical protein [Calidifontibacter sp. DB2511S]
MSLTLADAVDRLYAGAPEEFVATRKELAAQARSDGDRELAKEVLALRRPSTAAHLVNMLARRTDPPGLANLTEVGEGLRSAQHSLDAPAMKQFAAQRQRVIDQLLREAADLGSVTGNVREQLVQTFTAAIADPAAQQAVTSGQLVNPLSYSGFGEVDLDGAVAATLPERPPSTSSSSSGKTSGSASEKTSGSGSDKKKRSPRSTSAKSASAQPSATSAGRAAKKPSPARVAQERERQRVEQLAAQAVQRAQADLDRAEAAVARARATLKDAEATRALAQDRLERAQSAYDTATSPSD